MKSININELDKKLYKDAIDIREVNEYQAGKITGIKNIPMTGLLMNPEQFMKKEQTYYIMCLSGRRSAMTVKKLEKQGYNVINLDGGYSGYIKK